MLNIILNANVNMYAYLYANATKIIFIMLQYVE